jgi:two-component system, NarL family, nitrate/nitrite response regulator NarL
MSRPTLNTQGFTERKEMEHRGDSSDREKMKRVLKITPRDAIRVFIVDRDSMSSELLAGALSNDQHFECAAVQPAELLRTLKTTKVDLVVVAVDVNVNPGSGFDLASAVCLAHPNIYIVVLLSQTSHEFVINAFRSGARGVFSRQQPMTTFLDCIQRVAQGFIWAEERESSALLGALKSIPAPNLHSRSDFRELTARELQVVICAAKGKTNKTIASELQLSEHTVKNYLFRAFDKLGVSNRVELLFYLTIQGHTFSAQKAECRDDDLRIDRSAQGTLQKDAV